MNQSEKFPSSAFGALELFRLHGMTTGSSSSRLTKFFVIYKFQFLLGGKIVTLISIPLFTHYFFIITTFLCEISDS